MLEVFFFESRVFEILFSTSSIQVLFQVFQNNKHETFSLMLISHSILLFILFIFCFNLGVVLNFKGFLIKNNLFLRGQKSISYTFRNIHILEMLPERFTDKFLKLLILV